MKGRALIFAVLVVLLQFSCRNSPKKPAEAGSSGIDSLGSSEYGFTSKGEKEEIPVNYFSPVEMSDLFQKIGVRFSNEYLASSIDPDYQTTSFDKAISLGILCADLGYLNMYEMTGSSLNLVNSIKKLAEALQVDQFFDFDAIIRLSLNKSNLDSLLFLSLTSYSKVDNYMRANDLGHLSALMMTGVWLEGQYLTTQVFKKYPDKRLRDRIGEQKLFLSHLVKTTAPYCDKDKQYIKLCEDLKKLNDKYNEVKITYTKGEPVSSSNGQGLEITQTETSNVEMSEEQLSLIVEISADFRNNLIKSN